MLIMRNKYFKISYVLVWCILSLDKSEAQNIASASASAIVVPGKLDQNPLQPNPVVESLAQSISDGLQNSEVLGDFAHFVIYQPHDMFYNIGVRYLTRYGIHDPTSLAKVAADAVEEVGVVTSQVYFGAIGYTEATFLFAQGIATINKVEALSLSYVNAVGVAACVDGLTGTASVLRAVVQGVFNVLKSYGLLNYDNLSYMYYLFAQEIKLLSGVN